MPAKNRKKHGDKNNSKSDRQPGKKAKRVSSKDEDELLDSDTDSESDEEEVKFEDFVKHELEFLHNSMTTVITNQQTLTERLDKFEKQVTHVDKKVKETISSLEFTQKDVQDLKNDNALLKLESKKVENALQAAETNLRNLIEQQNNLERFSRRNNLRLVGYEEPYNEAPTEPMTIVKRVLTEKFHMSDVIIEKAHRTGKKSAKPRQIIFKLNNYEDKMTIFSKKRGALIDVSYYFTDDITDMDL